MSPQPALDDDGFPLFPSLPGGREVPVTARSLMRVVAGIRGTAALTVQSSGLAAMVIFLDREPIDGVAVVEGRRVVGPDDVLDEIASSSADSVTVTEIDPSLAVVLGSYFLPTAVLGVPASVVVAEDFIRSLARPGQRGCVMVRAGSEIGLAFMRSGQVVLAYRQGGAAVGGLEEVAPLLSQPGATLWARIGPDEGPAPPPAVRPAPPPAVEMEPWPPVAPPAPPEPEPEPEPEPLAPVSGWAVETVETPAPEWPPPRLASESQWEAPSPPTPPSEPTWEATPPPPPAPAPAPAPEPAAPAERQQWAVPAPSVPYAVPAPPPPARPPQEAPEALVPEPTTAPNQALLDAALGEVRRVLGPHSVRVEGVFLRAEQTPAGLRAAAESLRHRRARLISRETMDMIAMRVLAALDQAAT